MLDPVTPSSTEIDPIVGATLGRWRVLRRLGLGATGIVYLAEQPSGAQGALKLLHDEFSSSDHFVRRFAREARVLSRLQHVHCTSILDVGEYEDRPYIVMEVVPGHRLTTEIGKPAMTPVRAAALIRQVLMGLSHAHGHGIVHRDIKPDNIMVVPMASVDVVKILDFGFAHINDWRHSQSNAEVVPGTPGYMSPEQAKGQQAEARSDLYSTGIMLYELCVGKKPFVDPDALQVLSKHIHEPPVPPRFVVATVSEALEHVILRALAKDPEERFDTADTFREALDGTPEGQAALRGPVAAAPQRNRRWMIVAAAAAVVAVGIVVAMTRKKAEPPPPPPPPAVVVPVKVEPPPPAAPDAAEPAEPAEPDPETPTAAVPPPAPVPEKRAPATTPMRRRHRK